MVTCCPVRALNISSIYGFSLLPFLSIWIFLRRNYGVFFILSLNANFRCYNNVGRFPLPLKISAVYHHLECVADVCIKYQAIYILPLFATCRKKGMMFSLICIANSFLVSSVYYITNSSLSPFLSTGDRNP